MLITYSSFFFFFPLSQYGIFSMTVQDFAASEREEIHVCSGLAKEIQVSLFIYFFFFVARLTLKIDLGRIM